MPRTVCSQEWTQKIHVMDLEMLTLRQVVAAPALGVDRAHRRTKVKVLKKVQSHHPDHHPDHHLGLLSPQDRLAHGLHHLKATLSPQYVPSHPPNHNDHLIT